MRLTSKQSKPVTKTEKSAVDGFLAELDQRDALATSGGGRPGLIFSLDATASRQAVWTQSSRLVQDMFTHTKGLSELDMQLVFYRGYGECKSSGWLNNADSMVNAMSKVTCLAGQTQIARILKHTATQARSRQVTAAVFIGDCMEENIDTLGNLAGQLKLLGVPVFFFQEGNDPTAAVAFAQLAKLSGGAHCQFNQASANELGRLLNAVAVYAAGGKSALKQLSARTPGTEKLLQQLD